MRLDPLRLIPSGPFLQELNVFSLAFSFHFSLRGLAGIAGSGRLGGGFLLGNCGRHRHSPGLVFPAPTFGASAI
jgi:hypothetical protein